MSPPLPPRVGRYEPRNEIGRGTIGPVYQACDRPRPPRRGPGGAPPPRGRGGGGRGPREPPPPPGAGPAARLSHPAIVVVHDVGRDPATGHVFMALEYLSGATLQDRLAQGPLPW